MNAAYSANVKGFEFWMDALRKRSPQYVEWTSRIGLEIWTQHRDEGRRWGHMTTNISECINAVLKGTRFLPISSIVRATYERLQQLWVRKGREAHGQLVSGAVWSQRLLRAIEECRESQQYMRVTHCDRRNSVFLVEDGKPGQRWAQREFRVMLTTRSCDCGEFQAFHYPCRHAFAACASAGLEWGECVDPIFTVAKLFKVYELEFPPIPDEKLWPEWMGTRLRPNPAMKRKAKGRPVSTRIRNEMDIVERPEKRCGLCRQYGHTRRSCPNAPHME